MLPRCHKNPPEIEMIPTGIERRTLRLRVRNATNWPFLTFLNYWIITDDLSNVLLSVTFGVYVSLWHWFYQEVFILICVKHLWSLLILPDWLLQADLRTAHRTALDFTQHGLFAVPVKYWLDTVSRCPSCMEFWFDPDWRVYWLGLVLFVHWVQRLVRPKYGHCGIIWLEWTQQENKSSVCEFGIRIRYSIPVRETLKWRI